ncbi:MAG: hypothetical protein AAB431_02920 [Patescibacteria group bacterium]
MPTKKSTSIYRTLLREAFTHTWQRKSLWIFGIFAGFISTGGVFEVALSGLKQATAAGSFLEQLLDQTFVGYAYASQAILLFQQIGPGQIGAFLILCTLFCLFFLVLGIISQAALIHSVRFTQKNFTELRRSVHKHFWDIFLVDAFTKILTILLTALTTLPTLLFLLNGNSFSSTLLFCHLVLFIPAVIVLHILSMLAIVDVVEADHHAFEAIRKALQLFKKQWLTTLEFGFVLFALVCIAGLCLVTLLILLSIPYSFLFTLTFISGSSSLLLGLNLVLLLIILGLIFTVGGALVSFQYSAWCAFYKHAAHRTYGKKAFAKILRLFHAS